MAKSVAIVLSQSRGGDPQQRDFEETLVAQLLMEDRVEVAIIPHLTQLDESSTGKLCLEGVTGDMILLASQPPLATDDQLRSLGVTGRFGRTSQTADVQVPASSPHDAPRTLYSVDLSGFATLEQARTEILRIRDEATRPVVLLADLTSGAVLAPTRPAATRPSAPRDAVDPRPSPPTPARPVSTDPDSDALDQELDGLLDEFERW